MPKISTTPGIYPQPKKGTFKTFLLGSETGSGMQFLGYFHSIEEAQEQRQKALDALDGENQLPPVDTVAKCLVWASKLLCEYRYAPHRPADLSDGEIGFILISASCSLKEPWSPEVLGEVIRMSGRAD